MLFGRGQEFWALSYRIYEETQCISAGAPIKVCAKPRILSGSKESCLWSRQNDEICHSG